MPTSLVHKICYPDRIGGAGKYVHPVSSYERMSSEITLLKVEGQSGVVNGKN